jgi:VanZ family protein
MSRTLFWLYLVSLVAASLLPTAHLPDAVNTVWDKAQHALGFALLTVLAWRAYPGVSPAVLAVALTALGGLIEVAQAASGWRHGEWGDLLADGTGIALGLLLRRLASRWPRLGRSRGG